MDTKLKVLLNEQGRKNKWLAKQCKMDESSISTIVNGKRLPLLPTAIRIARVMGVTVEELWGWTADGE